MVIGMVSEMDLNRIFDDYNEVMIFASSTKQKLNLIEENDGFKNSEESEHLVEFMEFQIAKIESILLAIDDLLSNYHQINIEIEPHELNGMEQDIASVKKEYISILDSLR
jgi:hypothetical protein